MEPLVLFDSKAKQLFWRPIDPSHVDSPQPPRLVEPEAAYFGIRLCEMYLATARKLWKQVYPMVHCFVGIGAAENHSLVGPAQFIQLGDANLDRIVNLNTPLFGPMPYDGEPVSMMAGLYAVPGHDAAKALIDLVAELAALDPLTADPAISLAKLIKAGVESILGLDHATLQLGIRDGFNQSGRPLTSGYFAGIGAAESAVDPAWLWVRQGRLLYGKDLATANAYSDNDYMLIAIDRSETRDDWRHLSELRDSRTRLTGIAHDAQFTAAEKRSRLAALWPLFQQALANSPNLTEVDRGRIAALYGAELLRKLQDQSETNPFLKAA